MGRARQGAEHGDWWKEGAGSQVREDGRAESQGGGWKRDQAALNHGWSKCKPSGEGHGHEREAEVGIGMRKWG